MFKFQGGRHIDYVVDQIVAKLIEVVKKKNKAGVTVKPFQVVLQRICATVQTEGQCGSYIADVCCILDDFPSVSASGEEPCLGICECTD